VSRPVEDGHNRNPQAYAIFDTAVARAATRMIDCANSAANCGGRSCPMPSMILISAPAIFRCRPCAAATRTVAAVDDRGRSHEARADPVEEQQRHVRRIAEPHRDTQSLALTMTSLIRTARAEARAAPPSGPVSGFSAPGRTIGQLLRIQEAFSNT
jgi:hypothetical protein